MTFFSIVIQSSQVYSIFPFPLPSFVIFIVTLCHTHQRFPTLWPAFILFNLYTTDWPEVFFNLQQHGDQGSFKTYFCFCGGKTVNWEISTKKSFPSIQLCSYVAPMSGSGRCCSPIICSSTHHVYLELATRRDAEEGVTLLGSFAPTGL